MATWEGDWPLDKEQIRTLLYHNTEHVKKTGDKEAADKAFSVIVAKQRESAPDSPEYATALSCWSSLNMMIGNLDRAIELMVQATEVPVTSGDEKERLTRKLNLGDLLTASGRLEEAEVVLRDCLEERKAFYGEKHPGVAFGLHALAEALYAQGKAKEAKEMAHNAFEINADNGQKELIDNLALYAFTSAACGDDNPMPYWDQCSHPLNTELLKGILEKAGAYARERKAAAAASIDVLLAAKEKVKGTPVTGEGSFTLETRIVLSNQLFNIGHLVGDKQLVLSSCQDYLRHALQAGDPELTITAYLAMAVALEETGAEASDVHAQYKEAIEVARREKSLPMEAKVLRNQALAYSSAKDHENAEAMFLQAMEKAKDCGDKMIEGRVLCAFGVWMQHQGEKLEEAKELLTQALPLLTKGCDEVQYATAHLGALEEGKSCGCEEKRASNELREAMEKLVKKHYPAAEDLVRGIRFVVGEGGEVKVSIDFTRQPTEDEATNLERAVRLAQQELAESR